MLLREKQTADATGAASEPDQVDAEREAGAVQNDAADGMAGKPQDTLTSDAIHLEGRAGQEGTTG
jgi:hypothetical protein